MRAFCNSKPSSRGAGAAIDNVSAAYLPQNNPPVVRSITVLTTATAMPPRKDIAARPSAATDALQRYGNRYRRRGSREFDRHADADALARGFPTAHDFLAGRRSGWRQAGL